MEFTIHVTVSFYFILNVLNFVRICFLILYALKSLERKVSNLEELRKV